MTVYRQVRQIAGCCTYGVEPLGGDVASVQPSTRNRSSVAGHQTQDEARVSRLVDLLLSLAERTQAVADDVLAELDLTYVLAMTLWKLPPERPAPTMRRLATSLRCEPSTMTFIADRLEKRGLLVRRVDPANRRIKTLELTDSGRAARRRLVETMTHGSPLALLAREQQDELSALFEQAIGPDHLVVLDDIAHRDEQLGRGQV